MKINFTKMHGLGNDFLFIQKNDLAHIKDIKKFVEKYSDRRIGIGCDQLILYENNNLITNMYIYNSDGSEAKACGNATRCLAYMNFLENNQRNLTIKAGERFLDCIVEQDGEISVNMGKVIFDADWMPDRHILSSKISDYLSSDSYICADVGNPHLVIIDNDLSYEDMNIIGRIFEKSEIFPEGVNVNFVKINSDDITLKVWERGVGFSYACGSGACASFASCIRLGYLSDRAYVKFQLGKLDMRILNDDVIMKGSATLVARGEICE
jgi:diaminopimelate epimerase